MTTPIFDADPDYLAKGPMHKAILNVRQIVADRYNKAVVELFDAYVDLAGIDAAIMVNSGECISSFGAPLDDVRVALHAHPLAQPMDRGSFAKRIADARKRHLQSDSWRRFLLTPGVTFGESTPGGSN